MAAATSSFRHEQVALVTRQWCRHPRGLAHRRQELQHSPNRPTSLSPTGQLHCRRTGGDGDGEDRRKGSPRLVSHRLSEEERQRILLTCNQPEYASLPPGQIVPALADQGHYIGSESSFYRVLHQAGQCQRRGRARPPQAARTVPRLRADGPNQLWSWDITPTCPPLFAVCGFTSTW